MILIYLYWVFTQIFQFDAKKGYVRAYCHIHVKKIHYSTSKLRIEMDITCQVVWKKKPRQTNKKEKLIIFGNKAFMMSQ